MFGYRVEADFDLAKEQRRDRLWWVVFGGIGLWSLYLWSGAFYHWTYRPYLTESIQAWIASSMFYGDSFYVRRRDDLGKAWLWKALIATIPFHLIYLVAIFWSDRVLPQVMSTVVISLPVLTLGLAIESIQLDKVIEHFKPSRPERESAQPVVQP
jgi:hypothetical protein